MIRKHMKEFAQDRGDSALRIFTWKGDVECTRIKRKYRIMILEGNVGWLK